MSDTTPKETFWDHLDALRAVIVKSCLVTLVCGVVAFLFKDQVFDIVFAPKEDSFITYKWLNSLGALTGGSMDEGFSVQIINTGLAQQFIIHMKTALCVGLIFASPYILYLLFQFISPALYDSERKYTFNVVGSGYLMFFVGMLVSYYLIFPLTFRFLGTYQVSGDVVNMISLDSYMGTLLTMCLSMGLVFEMPVLCWLFGKLGFLTDSFMKTYRRHAVVLILVAAAVITPTSDAFTLLAVALPMCLLYEVSILIVGKSQSKPNVDTDLQKA